MTISSVKIVVKPRAGQRIDGARVTEISCESACGVAESETARAGPKTGAQAAANERVAAAEPTPAAVTTSAAASAARRRHVRRSRGQGRRDGQDHHFAKHRIVLSIDWPQLLGGTPPWLGLLKSNGKVGSRTRAIIPYLKNSLSTLA
jgi:hypothetical protein